MNNHLPGCNRSPDQVRSCGAESMSRPLVLTASNRVNKQKDNAKAPGHQRTAKTPCLPSNSETLPLTISHPNRRNLIPLTSWRPFFAPSRLGAALLLFTRLPCSYSVICWSRVVSPSRATPVRSCRVQDNNHITQAHHATGTHSGAAMLFQRRRAVSPRDGFG